MHPSLLCVCVFFFLLLDRLQLLDLLDEVGLLIVELLVLGPVRVELGQEIDQLVLISQQNVQDGLGLVGICHKDLQRVQVYVNADEEELLSLTLNTWKASNWMFLDFSFSMFIMSFKLSGFEMYLVITWRLKSLRQGKMMRRIE